MVYFLTLFRDLVASVNSSWDNLKLFLTSPAGGKLVINQSECGRYAIIHYDKLSSDMSISHVRWFRSVVWDIQAMKPLSVAPPAAVPEFNADDLASLSVLQEYIDGINLNIFANNAVGTLQLTSRTSFGAKGTFYSKKTFAELFNECLNVAPESTKAVFTPDNFAPKSGEFSRFVSVLIQHPEHRIVEQVSEPRLWFIHTGSVADDGTIHMNEEVCNIPLSPSPMNGESIQAWFERMVAAHDWKWRGVVLKDGAGRRWCLKNVAYEMVRSLRGNTPRSSERFFILRQKGMLATYLTYYPEDLADFTKYETWLHDISHKLDALYSDIYRNKLEIEPPTYMSVHLKALHKKYTTELRAARKKITSQDVFSYLNSLPVPRLMFLLRVSTTAPATD